METAAQSMKTLKNEAAGLSAGGDSPAQPQINRTGATPSNSGQSVPTCYRCGIRGHAVSKCQVDKNIICHYCQKKGHMQRACKSKNKGVAPTSDTGTQRPKSRCRIKPVGRVEEESDSDDSKDSPLCLVESKGVVHSPLIKVKVKLDNCVVNMAVDTGAAMSLMSQTTFQGLWPGRGLQPSQVRLRAYTREQIPVVGCCNVNRGGSLTPHQGQGEAGQLCSQYGGGYRRRYVSNVPDHFSRAVAREGSATLSGPPQSLHKGTDSCCGMLQCQHRLQWSDCTAATAGSGWLWTYPAGKGLAEPD